MVESTGARWPRSGTTAGGSGIGASIVEHLCTQRARVAFVDIQREASAALVQTVEARSLPAPCFIHCDLRDIAALRAAVAEARRLYEARIAVMAPPAEVAKVVHRSIDGPHGPIELRIYTPSGSGPFPLMVFFHGSGFVLCSLDTHDGMCRNLAAGIAVDDLAVRGAMSPRTLTRRFRSSVGMPPGEWLLRERLRLAQRLLESTDDPVELVARRAGYDSAVTMRAQFASRLRTSPRGYRGTFRARAEPRA